MTVEDILKERARIRAAADEAIANGNTELAEKLLFASEKLLFAAVRLGNIALDILKLPKCGPPELQ